MLETTAQRVEVLLAGEIEIWPVNLAGKGRATEAACNYFKREHNA